MRGTAAAVLFAIALVSVPLSPSIASAPGVDERPPSSCQRRGRRRRVVRPRVTAAQRRQIRRRHVAATRHEIDVWLRTTPPPLVLRSLASPSRFVLTPEDDTGGFDEADLALASQALAFRDDGSTHPIHPRLVELTYAAARHFRAPYVHVVSGYRGGRASSRHAQGRALDFVLPGVTDRRLAAWLRTQGFVGVGIYPNSGFVHLDVRARSYFWSDASGPDQRGRERQILRALGPRHDHAARARGVEPVADLADTRESEEESTDLTEATLDAVPVEAGPVDAGALGRGAPDAGVP